MPKEGNQIWYYNIVDLENNLTSFKNRYGFFVR